MIFFKIVVDKKIVFSNFEDKFKESSYNSSSVRKVIRIFPQCEVELFGTDYDYKLLANNHIASKTAEAYAEIIKIKDDFKNTSRNEYNILSHNFITSQSFLQDALGQIIPEESLVRAENHL